MSNITRTYFNTVVSVKLFDNGTDEIITRTATIDGKIALNDVKKVLEKSGVFSYATILKITNVSYDEALYSMSEADFMKHGKAYDERSKETRDCVTKEIIASVAACVAVDNETMSVETVDYPLPRKMSSDEAKRFINKRETRFTVVKCDIVEVNQLYAMPIDEFKAKAEKLPPRLTENK